MKETKLLNCPFCKEELEIVGKGHYFAHKTNGCIIQHLCFEIDDDKAVEKWNTRKPMERILERLEEAHEYISGTCETLELDGWWHMAELNKYKAKAICDAIEIAKEEGGIE